MTKFVYSVIGVDPDTGKYANNFGIIVVTDADSTFAEEVLATAEATENYLAAHDIPISNITVLRYEENKE